MKVKTLPEPHRLSTFQMLLSIIAITACATMMGLSGLALRQLLYGSDDPIQFCTCAIDKPVSVKDIQFKFIPYEAPMSPAK